MRGCCRGVEELLERISNGKLADDRRSAMAELEAAVAENRAAKLAFGSMGKQIASLIAYRLDMLYDVRVFLKYQWFCDL